MDETGRRGDAVRVRFERRAAAYGVVAVATWMGATGAWATWQNMADVVSPRSLADAQGAYDQFECVEDELKRRLPHDARVFVSVPEHAMWRQRLVEASSPWFAVVPTPEEATHVIGIGDETAAGCRGIGVSIRAR